MAEYDNIDRYVYFHGMADVRPKGSIRLKSNEIGMSTCVMAYDSRNPVMQEVADYLVKSSEGEGGYSISETPPNQHLVIKTDDVEEIKRELKKLVPKEHIHETCNLEVGDYTADQLDSQFMSGDMLPYRMNFISLLMVCKRHGISVLEFTEWIHSGDIKDEELESIDHLNAKQLDRLVKRASKSVITQDVHGS